MKKPGFSTARAKPFKLGPLTTVASVSEARSLTSPALKAIVAAAAGLLLLSTILGFRTRSKLSHGDANRHGIISDPHPSWCRIY